MVQDSELAKRAAASELAQNGRKDRRAIVVLISFVFAVVCWERQNLGSTYQERLERNAAIIGMMVIVKDAADEYASQHAGEYPQRLDKQFIALIDKHEQDKYSFVQSERDRWKGDQTAVADYGYWLTACTVATQDECMKRLEDLGPDRVLYCLWQRHGQKPTYFVLGNGKDGRPRRGPGGKPMVMGPEPFYKDY